MRLDLDSALAALLVPDPLISAATLIDAPAGGSPRPAVPVPTSPDPATTRGPEVYLHASCPGGGQTGDLAVQVSRGGLPGRGAEVVVQVDDGGTPLWLGWAGHVLERVCEDRLDKGTDGPRNHAGVEALDGAVVVLWLDSGVLYARRWTLADDGWEGAAVVVADGTAAYGNDGASPQLVAGCCDVVRLGDGRLLALFLCKNTDADNDIGTAVSSDHGSSWTVTSWAASNTPIPGTTSVSSLAAGYDAARNAVLVLVRADWTVTATAYTGWVQYASGDDGGSFELVDSAVGLALSESVSHASIVAVPEVAGGGLAVLARGSSTAGRLLCLRAASPYQVLRTSHAQAVVVLAAMTGDTVEAWADPDGTLWAAGGPNVGATRLAWSRDGGASWTTLSTPLFDAGTGIGTGVDRLLIVPRTEDGAGLLVFATDTSMAARPDQQLAVLEVGGWRSLCQPRVAGGWPGELRAWSQTWVAWTDPVSAGWTLAGTAGTLATTGDWGLALSGASRAYELTLSSASSTTGAIMHAEVRGVTSTTVDQAAFLRLEVDGAAVELRLGTASLVLRDVHGASTIATVSATMSERVHLCLAVRGTTAAAYWRADEDRAWQLVASGTVTVSGSTAQASWGHGSTVSSPVSTWTRVSVCEDAGYGAALTVTDSPAYGTILAAAPASLPGASLPAAPGYLGLPEGVHVWASGGPARRGDAWDVDLSDDYPAAHLLSRSRAEVCRTSGTGAARWAWEPAGGTVHHPGGHAVGLAVFGANFLEAELQGWDGSAWQTVASLDLAVGGIAYTRSGDTLRVASGGIAGRPLRALDLVGATVRLASGVLRRVRSATGGTPTSGVHTLTLQLEGITGSEPTSGTATIGMRTGAVVVLGHVTGYSRWALYVPTGSSVDGHYEAHRVVIGAVHVLGARYSHGRVVGTQPQVDVVEVPGLRGARRLAAPVRRIELAWVEGVPTRRHTTTPSWISAGGTAVAGAGDLSVLEALQASHGGGLDQLVYLPRLAHDPDATGPEEVRVLGRDLAILATLTGELVEENVIGEEAWNEVVRLSGVTLLEEPEP
jgi:hypothetical protein